MVDLGPFDVASRGVYDCAGLVWRLRARHFAALGSLAVILAIAFDPFTQNLIHYYPKLIADSSGTAIVSSNPQYDTIGPVLETGVWYLKMHCAMDNVAEAMSKAIWDNASPSNVTTAGQAMSARTHIFIHWQWIILPVLVWLLCLVTLLGTIWKTRTARIPT